MGPRGLGSLLGWPGGAVLPNSGRNSPGNVLAREGMIDATGSSNYAFEHEDFLLDSLVDLLADGSTIYGHYLVFKNFAFNSIIPEKSRKWFKKESVKDQLAVLGFNHLKEYETSPISQGGPRESFFVEGEEIFNYLYIGKLCR